MRRSALAAILIAVVLTVALTAVAQTKRPEKVEKVKDPVCGLVVEKSAELSASHKGHAYYFCSKADMEQFKKAPEKYTKP